MADLAQRVRELDYSVQNDVRQLGPAAVPQLLPLTRSQHEDVRQLALYCLDAAGGPDIGDAFVEGLHDEDAVVAGAALQGLRHHPDSITPDALLQAYDRRPTDEVLAELPLVFAMMSTPADVDEIKQRQQKEPLPEARLALTTVAAKLGDEEARREFAEALETAEGHEIKRVLDLCVVIDQHWLLKSLRPLLDDETPVLRVGVDARPDLIDTLRACDMAIIVLASIHTGQIQATQWPAGQPLSFAVDRATNFSAEQREEARRYLDGLPDPFARAP